VCRLLQRFLGCLCLRPAVETASSGGQGERANQLYRAADTLRQRISRLVRKTLSFSKKRENHIGAIWYFVHHYNASLA
jgi:hypothetical protein